MKGPESKLTNHFQEHSLSFSPRFCKFERNKKKSDCLNHVVYQIRSYVTFESIRCISNVSKYKKKIWRTRLRAFLRIVGEYGPKCLFFVW